MQYCYAMTGRDQRILPALVSSGDTILLSRLNGAWLDTRRLFWNCPDGWIFAGGVCGPGSFMTGSDPAPSVLHMSIIARIAGVYYDVVGVDSNGNPTTFTVPPGISNDQVTFLCNTDAPDQTTGDISFCADVTNNAIGDFTHTFLFDQAPSGWIPDTIAGVPAGSWVPGVGWDTVDAGPDTGGVYNRQMYLHINLPTPREITSMKMIFDYHAGAFTGPGVVICRLWAINPGETDYVYFTNGGLPDGDDQQQSGAFDRTAVTMLGAWLRTSAQNVAAYSGSAKLLSVIVTGKGTDPFI